MEVLHAFQFSSVACQLFCLSSVCVVSSTATTMKRSFVVILIWNWDWEWDWDSGTQGSWALGWLRSCKVELADIAWTFPVINNLCDKALSIWPINLSLLSTGCCSVLTHSPLPFGQVNGQWNGCSCICMLNGWAWRALPCLGRSSFVFRHLSNVSAHELLLLLAAAPTRMMMAFSRPNPYPWLPWPLLLDNRHNCVLRNVHHFLCSTLHFLLLH